MTKLPKPPSKAWYKRAWLWCLIILLLLIVAGVGLQQAMQSLTPAADTTEQAVTAEVRTLTKAISTTGKIAYKYGGNVVEFLAAESEVFDLTEDQTVELTIPSYDNGATTYHGTVESVDDHKTLGSTTDSGYLVQVEPDDLPEEVQDLIDLTVNIKVVVESKVDVLSIERAAVQYDDADQAYVWLPNSVRQDVTTGFEGDDYIEITEGLESGDTVILNIPKAEVTSPF